ncbi:hypothetical protein THRCLA_02824 [Thraustotheca clavata]|uniref:Secreted protein n=1 Tax=Thraustotheca clavata TaxID=74557 RepID=A0A0A7CLZ0_9STRA|nr:secreted protein [Thraustotheca clavata]OQS04997.1 hypothetical protein THRCLA_02824 [Thraustotheca clavata]
MSSSYLITVLVFLLLSVFLSNAIAWIKQFRQQSRIFNKTQQLSSRQRGKTIPVTILTGFLGSGKTTLLNAILSSPDHGYKIMILENEVGAVSIDHELIKNVPREGVVVMQNGCMCCSASTKNGNELERILDHLLQVQADIHGFDYLIVETTGLADPGPIVQTFLELRASRYRLDGVVTLVDIQALLKIKVIPTEMQAQLTYADVIAMTKTDLFDENEVQGKVDKATEIIREMNPDAPLLAKNKLDVGSLLNIHTFDVARYSTQLATAQSNPHRHSTSVSTVFLTTTHELDLQSFGIWLNDVVNENVKENVFRIKGIVAVKDDNSKWVLQGVLDTYTLAPSAPWASDAERVTQIVIIGKNLDAPALEASFTALTDKKNM